MMEKVKRDTTRDLFNIVLQLVKDNGCYEKAGAIMDYCSPYSTVLELSNYRFNFDASVLFGSSEGIYINCYLFGEFTEDKQTETRQLIGVFKTLRDDLDSMKIMGELCGALVYYAREYVNINIDRYTPFSELIQEQQ